MCVLGAQPRPKTPSNLPSMFAKVAGVPPMSINELLAQIVLANGGTVTNPDVRNELLRDWLDALTP